MATTRNTLTAPQQAFIVRKLAAFEPPRAISAAFHAVFGAVLRDDDILAIDPETTVVSPELHVLFLAERERVLLDPKSAVFAAQAARLILLSNQVRAYIANNQPAEARLVLRQIAEEQGVVGGKAAGKALPAPGGGAVDAIQRTIVDPKVPAAEPPV